MKKVENLTSLRAESNVTMKTRISILDQSDQWPLKPDTSLNGQNKFWV